jgi:antitoxin ParD1/3/4
MTDGNGTQEGRVTENQQGLPALREAVKVGDQSGPSIPAEEVFAELRAMITNRRRPSK